MELLLNLKLVKDVHISKLCRLCLTVSEDTDVVSIFEKEDSDITYQKRIMQCLQIKVDKDDGLPSTICQTCADKVKNWFQFFESVRLSDRRLRDFIHSPTPQVVPVKSFTESLSDDCNNEDDDIPLSQFIKSRSKETTKKRIRRDLSKSRGRAVKVKPFCASCNLKFTKLVELCAHQKEAHGLSEEEAQKVVASESKDFVSYRCHVCLKEFENRCELRDHCRDSHNVKVIYPYSCSHCNRQFPSWTLLVVHERQHTGEKPYSCDLCGKENFISFASLRRHKLMHMKVFSCDQCGRNFNCDSALKAHIRCKHTDEKPFLCNVCGRSFSLAAILNAHMASHSSERKYECEICGFRSKTSGNHHRHKSRHSQGGPKIFNCQTCGKAYNTKLKLTSHQIIHTPSKHICKLCGKGFLFKNKLERHTLLVHARERPYPCHLCDKKLASKFGLGIHLKTHSKHQTGDASSVVKTEESLSEPPQFEPKIEVISNDVKMIIGGDCEAATT